MTRIVRDRIRELRSRVLTDGIQYALKNGWDTDSFLLTVNGVCFSVARDLIEELNDPGIIYQALRDLGTPDRYIEAEGLEGAIRRIAAWIHPSKIIEDDYPELYPETNALLACAAKLKINYPSLICGNEARIIKMVKSVIPLGLPQGVSETIRAYLEPVATEGHA